MKFAFNLMFRLMPKISGDVRSKIIGSGVVTFTTLCFCLQVPSRTWNEYKLPALRHRHTHGRCDGVLFSFGLWSPTLDDAGQHNRKSRFLTHIPTDMKKSNEDEVLNAGEEDQMVSGENNFLFLLLLHLRYIPYSSDKALFQFNVIYWQTWNVTVMDYMITYLC